jgi:DNA-binding CsgD family transcriptional regulator
MNSCVLQGMSGVGMVSGQRENTVTPIRVYAALLSCDSATLDDLAHAIGTINIAGLQDSLDALVRIGLIHRSTLVEDAYRATAPDGAHVAAMTNMVTRLADDVEIIKGTLAVSAKTFNGTQLPTTNRIEGGDAILGAISHLCQAASTRIDCALTSIPSADSLAVGLREDMHLYNRGITVRSLYPPAAQGAANVLLYASEVSSLGGEVRTSSRVPMHIVIVDSSTAIVADWTKDIPEATMTDQEPMVSVLVDYFEDMWQRAVVLDAISHAPSGLTDIERAVLEGLQHGCPDTESAHRLGVSLSTVRRAYRSLLARVGTKSRFALGVEAARRGWIT